MEMTSAKAMLVDAGDLEAANAVTATIPRDQIERALASDEPTDLFLEVVRPSASGTTEPATVTVAWERPDLERLLVGTGGEAVTFAFRSDELERAIEEPEFEGHGLRETVLVLAVAATAAASASNALAKPVPVGGPADNRTEVVAVHDEAGLTARGIEATQATEQPTVIPYVSQGQGVDASQFGGTAPAAEQPTVIPYLSQGEGVDASQFGGTAPAAEQPTVIPYLSQGEGVDASQFGGTAPAAEQPTVIPYVSQGEGVDVSQFGGVAATPAPVHDEAGLTARGIESAPVADSGSGFELPSVDPGTAAAVGGAAGGAALLIAAAAFAARGRRPMRPV